MIIINSPHTNFVRFHMLFLYTVLSFCCKF